MRHVVIVSFALIASSCLDEGFGRSEGENDPVGLQRRAIQRIDDFTDTFRKSGVIAPKLPELQRAFDELEVSKDAFVRNGDRAATALCLIKEGDVVRMVSDLRGDQAGRIQALELYRQGEVIAREAWHRTYQARALIGQVRVESSRMGATNLGAAVSHIEQAVGLGEASGDDTLQFETLEYSAFVQMRRNNLRGALTTFDRALGLLEAIR